MKQLEIRPFRASSTKRSARRWHLGITLGAAHAYQFQSLISFETLSEAETALNEANTNKTYRSELYGFKKEVL